MLAPSMTYKEMWDHLDADRECLRHWKDKYRQKAIKELKKERYFPTCKMYEYESSAGNDYRIFFM